VKQLKRVCAKFVGRGRSSDVCHLTACVDGVVRPNLSGERAGTDDVVGVLR
jgi:hypothetical protein